MENRKLILNLTSNKPIEVSEYKNLLISTDVVLSGFEETDNTIFYVSIYRLLS